MANEVFLDTSYVVALSSPGDDLHGKAVEVRYDLVSSRWRLVTTRAVLPEIGNAFARLRFRAQGIRLLDAFEADPNVEIVPLSESLYADALRLYRSRPDKEWGIVDCISFVVMQQRGIYQALTSDEHFRQAGYRPFLNEAV